MRACSENQRLFVIAMVETGARSQTECALVAGIGGSKESASVWASRAMRKECVLAALQEETKKAFRGDVIMARSRLRELLDKPADVALLKAYEAVLNRGGMIVETQHHVTVDHNIDVRTDRELLADVATVLQNPELRQLAGPVAEIVEGEFAEVEEETSEEDILAALEEDEA